MEPHVLVLPKWLLVIRVIQGIFSLIILAVAAYGTWWVPFGAWGFAIFTSLATIVVILYTVLTSSVNALKAAYNYWAVLGLEIFMVVFWLASMAALAALRATFTIPVEIDGCFNDGTGGVCFKKRQLMKRAVATKGYLNMIAGSAALSAIIMLLFICTLTVFSIHLRRYRSSKAPSTAPPTNDKLEGFPMNPVAYNPAPQQQPEYTGQQYSAPQQQYAPTPPPQQVYSPPLQSQPYSPPPQQYQHSGDPNQQYHEAPTPNQEHPQMPPGQMYQ